MPNSEEPRTRPWSAEKRHNKRENSICCAFSKGILVNVPKHFFAKHFPEDLGWPPKDFQPIIWICKRPSPRGMTGFETPGPCSNDTSPTPRTSSAVNPSPSPSESHRKQFNSAKAYLNFVPEFMRGDQTHPYAEQNYANSY